jgi:hypothetical protein
LAGGYDVLLSADGDDDDDDDDGDGALRFAAEQKHVRRINGDFGGRVGNGWFPLEDVKMFVSLYLLLYCT